MKINDDKILTAIRDKAFSLGFLDCGVSAASFLRKINCVWSIGCRKKCMAKWVIVANHLDKRVDPRLLVEMPDRLSRFAELLSGTQKQTDTEAPVLSKYAYGVDYHFVMKSKLAALLAFIQQEIAPCEGRLFVDSAPVLDRAWAARAGLAGLEKYQPDFSGTWVLLAKLFSDLNCLPVIKLVRNHCEIAHAASDACPTKALVAPFVLGVPENVFRIKPLRIGEIDSELKGKFENRAFGCGYLRQDVCPWNLKSETHREPALLPATN